MTAKETRKIFENKKMEPIDLVLMRVRPMQAMMVPSEEA